MNESDYLLGRRAARLHMLDDCLKELGAYDPKLSHAWAASERAHVIAALRYACDRYGDNDWPDDANLTDVIDQHLCRHLESRRAS